MPREQIYAAIDIGTSKIVSIVARLGAEGELKPLGVGFTPAEGMNQGIVDDFGKVKESVKENLEECLRYLGRNPVGECFAVVNGEHLVGTNSREMLGQGEELLTVTDQHMRALISETSGVMRRQLDSSSEQALHIIPMRYRLDGMAGVRNPTGLHTNELQLESHVVRGASVPLGNTARALQACKMRVAGLVAHPLASGEGVLTADEREMGVVVVDIGAGTTKIACYREGTPCFSAVLPLGGNQLTRDMAVALRVPYQAAEELKIQHGHALPDELPSSAEVMMPATQTQPKRVIRRQELCEPLYLRSLQMLKLMHEELCKADMETLPPGGLALTGGVARMPGFAELAARGLRTQVRIGLPLWYAGLPESLRHPECAAALGVLQWAVKHRNQPPDPGRARGEGRGQGQRGWSPGALLRRPFARAGGRRSEGG